jgi:REP element-mobilizing transposase RayT
MNDFNLAPPPGFRGLDPDLPIRIYHRHLPHWRQSGAAYFVTFRLADSIPQQQLLALKRWRELWERKHPPPRNESDWHSLAREITSKTEAWLDEGYGECVFREPALSQEMARSLLHFQDQRWHLWSCAVLPNHIHLVTTPMEGHELEDTLESVKRFVSRKVNEQLHRSSTLWAQESYDRIIRDAEHLYRVVQYIARNPGKAGLPADRWVRWIHPTWEQAGWRFVD